VKVRSSQRPALTLEKESSRTVSTHSTSEGYKTLGLRVARQGYALVKEKNPRKTADPNEPRITQISQICSRSCSAVFCYPCHPRFNSRLIKRVIVPRPLRMHHFNAEHLLQAISPAVVIVIPLNLIQDNMKGLFDVMAETS
jgi:hypothetical protein